MRQMACHPDLVLRSKNNHGKFLAEDDGEAIVCRLCNEVIEDGIRAKCQHVFDRECIKQYLNTAVEQTVRVQSSVCDPTSADRGFSLPVLSAMCR
jgi:DNA repair protein RAD16